MFVVPRDDVPGFQPERPCWGESSGAFLQAFCRKSAIACCKAQFSPPYVAGTLSGSSKAMSESSSTSLVQSLEGGGPPARRGMAALAPRRGFGLWPREKVVKESALGALLKPIGVSLALLL